MSAQTPYIIDPETGEYRYFLRSGFNYDRDAASIESGLACLDPSLTQQQFAEDADINTIVRRFGLTGELPQNVKLPSYGDFSGITDFRGALEAVEAATADFMALPADIRARFDNDPQRFLEVCENPLARPALVELGLAVPPPGAATTVTAQPSPPSPPPEPAKT